MPWLRLWVDILDDPDLCELSDGAFRGWTLMLAAAKKHGNGGTLPDEKRLLLWLRHPRAAVDRWIEELIEAGLLEKDGESLTIHGWERWQEPTDRTNAKRQADYRTRHPNPPRNAVTPANSDSDSDTEQSRGEQTLRNKRNTVTLPLRNGSNEDPPPAAPATTPVSASPRDPDADRVCDLAAEIGGDIGWATWAENRLRMKDTPKAIEYALNEAVNAKVISTSFCGKVLARIAREGMPKHAPGHNGKGGAVEYKPKPIAASPPPSASLDPGPSIPEDEARSILFRRPSP